MRPLHSLLVIAALATAGCGGGRALPPPDPPAVSTPATPTTAAAPAGTAPAARTDLSIEVVAGACQAQPEAIVNGQPTVLRVHYAYEVAWTRDPAFRSFTVRTTGVDGRARDTGQELPRPTGGSVRTDTVVDIGPERLGHDAQMRFVLDPRNEIPEDDERNNATTLVLRLPAELPRDRGLAPLTCTAR